MLTDERLAEIEARAEAATPGPWYTVDPLWLPREPTGTYVIAGHHDPHVGMPILDHIETEDGDADAPGPNYDQSWLDLEFAAHARADIPALLAEVRRLRPVVDAARAYYRAPSILGMVALRESVRALEEAPRFREAHRLLLEVAGKMEPVSPTTASVDDAPMPYAPRPATSPASVVPPPQPEIRVEPQ